MHVLVVGGVKSFGVLFVELQQLYDVSAKQLGVVHGLASVLMMALGRSWEGASHKKASVLMTALGRSGEVARAQKGLRAHDVTG